MSTLLLSASPLNENSNLINQIQKKRENNRNKTIKKRTDHKINKLMKQIHDEHDEDENNNLGDFKPLPKPISMGALKREETEHNENESVNESVNEDEDNLNYRNNYNYNSTNPINNDYSVEKENFQNLPNTYTREYYKNIIPQYQNINDMNNQNQNQDIIKKLNYMIHLLEEQQDVKTSNITEEVILYSFLGIFIIFVLDSFARVGKYTR